MELIFCQQQQLDELDSIRIEHPLFKATLLLQGAQLIEFSPENNEFENLLWLSSKAAYKSGQSVRGGIPICWPWFGDIRKNPTIIQQQVKTSPSTSAHGFARNLAWQLNSIKEDCQQIVIELQLSADEKSKTIWPYEFNLIARFTFSQQLKVELITSNHDQDAFRVSQALHTYLATDDISQSYIHNAHNARYVDALDQWQEKKQHGRIAFSQETDRLYFFEPSNENPTESYTLRAETPNRQLNLQSENSLSAVIWNPWINKSRDLSQFKNEDYKQMFCIETANVLEDNKVILPGESSCLTLKLSKY